MLRHNGNTSIKEYDNSIVKETPISTKVYFINPLDARSRRLSNQFISAIVLRRTFETVFLIKPFNIK